jgi:SAM-dependent methyltransferase
MERKGKPKATQQFLLRKPLVDTTEVMPGMPLLDAYVCSKYGQPADMDVSPALRYGRRYVAADDCYEALVSNLVSPGVKWLDVGCGRDLFPSNCDGAREIAARAKCLVGVDPDGNVHENELLSARFQGVIEDFETSEKFDLVTMRMVAEHVVDAVRCVRKLAELTAPGGLVVIYTPWKWAPMSIIASLVPFSWHNRLKRLIWDSEAQDTFPTSYRMNTRRDLAVLFETHGFDETLYVRVDDCSILTRYPWLNSAEIGVRNLFCRAAIPYPEFCILSAYRRS